MTNLTRPQEAPRQNTGAPSAHDQVIADLQDRRAFGLEKYGTLLQYDNGRDHLVDAYQEELDKVVYLRNEIERRKAIAVIALNCGEVVHEPAGARITHPGFMPNCPLCAEALRAALGVG